MEPAREGGDGEEVEGVLALDACRRESGRRRDNAGDGDGADIEGDEGVRRDEAVEERRDWRRGEGGADGDVRLDE